MRNVSNENALPISLACIAALLISGCATGGGSPPPVPQLLQPALRGQTYEAMATTYRVPSDPFGYTSIRDLGPDTTITTAPGGETLHFSVNEMTDGGSPVIFNGTLTLPPEGSEFAPGLHYPTANRSLSHMAFGEWNQTLSGVTTGGFFAFGNATPGPAIPATGSATYAGSFTGMVWGLLGGNRINGSLSATANFDTQSVSIQGTPVSGSSSYTFSGVLSYLPGTNALSGALFTTGGHFGSAHARFFGPTAEELGGVFRVTRPVCIFTCIGNEVYMGSFGARR
jgi:hypothetical protein